MIKETSIAEFLDGKPSYDIVEEESIFTRKHVVERAKRHLGRQNWSLFGENCECFAKWCTSGKTISHQVEKLSTRIIAGD